MAGADGWAAMEASGASKMALVPARRPFVEGAPRDDTRRRCLRAVAPGGVRAGGGAVGRAWWPQAGARRIAVAGTTARPRQAGASRALHLGRACAPAARLRRA